MPTSGSRPQTKRADRRAHRTLDVTGHYARPDIFKLEVLRGATAPVSFKDADEPPPTPVVGSPSRSPSRRLASTP